ncbi:MFS general substrate transporter [Sporormia fimetaria CBS 119925]|uniref:MFS general substrate transporter n=1 Tax=Sporormia fimetaria CBS 119925 TaxID=1340428 RepID=A0A6A6V2X5_9PLEO|nr:MFS general substrate transporter [Sporormia fimetaria CBS 119925]
MAPSRSSTNGGQSWRSSTIFICMTVGLAAFTDMFLYGLIVPVLPFMLKDRINLPDDQVQGATSVLLAIFAAASLLASPLAGVLSDKVFSSRQIPFLLGLIFLLLSTILLASANSVLMLVFARALQGAAGGTVWTIGLTILVEVVGHENIGKTVGTIFGICSVATLFSPLVGGITYAKSGVMGVFGLGVSVITLDLIMRLLMVEKKDTAASADPESSGPNETTSLLSRTDTFSSDPKYLLPDPQHPLTKTFPILLLFQDRGLLTAFLMGFIQATLLGAFDATIPVVASLRYKFDSFKAGLLFFPLGASQFIFAPIFGWCTDRWGAKPLSIFGFAFLVPVLALLRLPGDLSSQIPVDSQVALYASLLALNGVGLAGISSANIVECGTVLEKYWKANERLFKGRAPYAELYGINNVVFSAGLMVGPMLSGVLTELVGYGNMNAVLAGICGIMAVLIVLFVDARTT